MDAAEIRIRAERRIGELMRAQKKQFGTAQGKRTDLGSMKTQVDGSKITLAQVGIDKTLADRARKYAAVPDEEWEQEAAREAKERQKIGGKEAGRGRPKQVTTETSEPIASGEARVIAAKKFNVGIGAVDAAVNIAHPPRFDSPWRKRPHRIACTAFGRGDRCQTSPAARETGEESPDFSALKSRQVSRREAVAAMRPPFPGEFERSTRIHRPLLIRREGK